MLVTACGDNIRSGNASDSGGGTDTALDGGTDLDLAEGLNLDFTFPSLEGERTAHVYVPDQQVARPAPLVIVLHGNGSSANASIGDGATSPLSEWLVIGEREQVAIAFVDGAVGTTGQQGWNDCRAKNTSSPETDDVAALRSLVDTLVQSGLADRNRVYFTGHSNGGHISLRMALESPGTIAATAVIAAAMPDDDDNECDDAQEAVPVLFMNGDADPVLPFEGGAMPNERGDVQSFDESIAFWVERNGLEDSADEQTIDRVVRGELVRTEVRRATYADDDGEVIVAGYRVVRGGHGEPSIKHEYGLLFESVIGKQSHDLETAEIMWEFFRTKSR